MNLDNFIIVVYFVIALAIAWYLCRGKIAPHFIGRQARVPPPGSR